MSSFRTAVRVTRNGPLLASTAQRSFLRRIHGQVRKSSAEKSEVSDASPQEGHAQKRFGRQSEEPQAGDRDRPQRGARKRRQGAVAEDRPQDRRTQDQAGGKEALTLVENERLVKPLIAITLMMLGALWIRA